MLSLKINLIAVALVVGALTSAHGEQSNCNEEGIVTSGQPNQFKVCSKGPDNTLSLKTFPCGDNSIFSEEKRMCVSNNAATLSVSENKIEAGLSIGVKSLKATNSDELNISVKAGSPSLGNYCPIPVGQYCNDCRKLVSCVDNKVAGERNCEYNCDSYEMKCSNQTVPECNKNNNSIVCQTNGLVPDPYFRNRYHLCVAIGSLSAPFTCRYGNTYDVNREDCNWSYWGLKTPYFPRCVKQYQTGVLWQNRKFFYVCIKHNGEIKHFIYKCEGNKTYTGKECA